MGTGPLGLGVLPDLGVRQAVQRNLHFGQPRRQSWPTPKQMHKMDIRALEALRGSMQEAITHEVGDFPAGWGTALQEKEPALYARYMRLNDVIGIRNWREATLRHDLKQNTEWVAYERKRAKNPYEAKFMDPGFQRLLENKVQDIRAEIAYRKATGTWRGT